MSIDSFEEIKTATVGIYTDSMEFALFIYNEKLQKLVPIGGKNEHLDADIQDTGNREAREEARIALFPGTGIYLDKDGIPTDEQPIIYIEGYELKGKKARDFLFYFRLHKDSPFEDIRNFPHSSQLVWLHKEEIKRGRIELRGHMREIIGGMVRENILRIMK